MASKIQLLGVIFLVLAVTLSSIDADESKHTAFEFINHLQGCHKGQNVSGIHQLKQYLQKFGYLNTNNITSYNDDLYDDVLESAIKSYQQYYHLKVTGTLDPETVKQMTMPRCGVPDIVNESHQHNHFHHNRKLIHLVSHYAFFQGSPRWRKSSLTYNFNSTVSVAVAQQLRSVCARAFQKWAQVSHFTFQEVGRDTSADIVIGFHVGSHGDNRPFDGPGSVLAHAFAPSSGQLHIDGQENWSTNPAPNQFDLESVVLHEIGHILGLAHDDRVPNAVMFSSMLRGTTKRNLHPDDIQGIRALYGLN